MDGEHQIMISEALNESDRLSSCNKRARKVMEPKAGPFHVYAFQAAELDENGNPEDVIISFNLGGIRMNEAAFRKLQTGNNARTAEGAAACFARFRPRGIQAVQRHRGRSIATSSVTLSCARAVFRASIPPTSPITGWTERSYYEVCTDPAIYAALEKRRGASGG
jgi:hypothetical protein